MKPKSPQRYWSSWTQEEIDALRQPVSNAVLAKQIGRSVRAIENKRSKLKLQSTRPIEANPVEPTTPQEPQEPSTVQQDLKCQDETYWATQFQVLSTKYQTLLKAESATARLVGMVRDLAPRSYSSIPPVWQSRRANAGKPQSAVLQFSDTHIGKTTSPNQTLSFGCYNFDIFMARLKYLEESALSIVENHITTQVPELVIAMLGDMLDGMLTHSNECGQLDPIFNQYYCGAHAIAQFIRNLAAHFPVVRIYDVVGNHPRQQSQQRTPTKNRYSNFDKFLYALIQALVRDIPNIKWSLDAQPYQLFEVQGFTFFCAHGDTLRGGDKVLGIPNHAVGRMVSAATQLMAKYGRKHPNFYLLGHLHRDIVLPHASGSVLINGGFPGIDEFGLSEWFTPADPTQKFFFVHPLYGKTATYDISLKFAETVPGSSPYTIPAEFSMH